MQTKLLYVLLLVAVCGSLLAAGPAYDKWARTTKYVKPHNASDYEDLIAQLQEGIEKLKAERDALIESREASSFVSVAALRATGYELHYLEPPKKAVEDSGLYLTISTNQICQKQFKEWTDKARQWDQEHEHALMSSD